MEKNSKKIDMQRPKKGNEGETEKLIQIINLKDLEIVTLDSFLEKRGFFLSKIYPSAIDKVSRKLKPQIPRIGTFGIPIRDEIKLEIKGLA